MYNQPYYASMGARFGALLIDELILGVITGAISFLFFMVTGIGHFLFWGWGDIVYGANVIASMFSLMSSILTVSLLPIAFHLLYAYMLYRTNGQTPGKMLLGIRVVRLDGQPISFGTAVVREMLLKSFANSCTSGLLNLGSFIWGCCTPEKKTVHDAVVNTVVIEDRQRNYMM